MTYSKERQFLRRLAEGFLYIYAIFKRIAIPLGFVASIFAPVQLAYVPLYVWAGFAWLMWVLTGIRDNGKIQKEEMAKVREQIEAR